MLQADPTIRLPVPPRRRRQRPLPWLLLGSVALHALVLAWQPPAAPLQLAEPAGRSAPLGLQLASTATNRAIEPGTGTAAAPKPEPVANTAAAQAQPAAANPARAEPESTRPAQAAGRAASPVTAAAQPETASATTPSPAHTAAAPDGHREPGPAAPTQPDASADSLQHSAVLSEIRDALQRHFFYPRLARLRNWEGDVLLGFQVRSDGRIDEVEVLESSGRAVLDQAALSALRSVRQVAYNAARPVDLQLPVAYRLH